MKLPWHFIPASSAKNIGRAYNEYASLVKDPSDWMIFQDRDVMILNHDYFAIISDVIAKYPKVGMFTCLTNRVGNLDQCLGGVISSNPDVKFHFTIATQQAKKFRTDIKYTQKVISGMIMVIQKKTWDAFGGAPEGDGQLLGIDNRIAKRVYSIGKTVAIMQGLYVFHYYRLHNGIKDKSHLK